MAANSSTAAGAADADSDDDDKKSGFEAQTFLEGEKLRTTMTREYFVIIGLLSATPRGLQLMKRYQLWTLLTSLLILEREDLPLLILHTLNYHSSSDANSEGVAQARSLLALCCNHRIPKVRLEDAGFDWKVLGPDMPKENDIKYVAWQARPAWTRGCGKA